MKQLALAFTAFLLIILSNEFGLANTCKDIFHTKRHTVLLNSNKRTGVFIEGLNISKEIELFLMPYPEGEHSEIKVHLEFHTDLKSSSKIFAMGGNSKPIYNKMKNWTNTQADKPMPLKNILGKRLLSGSYKKYPGPMDTNCFNAALRFHFPYRVFKNTSPKSLSHSLKKYFRKLNFGETIQFGDMILIYEKNNNIPYHAVTYLESSMIYHKAGSFYAPYGIQTLHSVIDSYMHRETIDTEIEARVFRRKQSSP